MEKILEIIYYLQKELYLEKNEQKYKFIIKYKTINFTLKNNYNTKQYKIITNINNQL